MTTRRLHAILRRHEIDPKFWPEFRAMIELGQTPSKELLTRMNRVANYEAARMEIADEVSKGNCEFPPDEYEIPAGYDFGVPADCDPEDAVFAASSGCAV